MAQLDYEAARTESGAVISWYGERVVSDDEAQRTFAQADGNICDMYWILQGWHKADDVWRKKNGYMNLDTAVNQFNSRNQPVPF
jgi:hypothetical protein